MKQRQPKACTFFILSMFLLFSCSKDDLPTPVEPPEPDIDIYAPTTLDFYVVGYFPYYRNPADVSDEHFKMCNVINYAFFNVNEGGLLHVNKPDVLQQVLTKAHANEAKVFVSINGSENFKNMALSPSGRNRFIKDVMAKVRAYGFDGVDIDWEYPRTSDGTDITYTQLMKELSDSLHRDGKYYLTTAITSGKYAGAVRDAIRNELFAYVDWFNIMVYDDFSSTVPYRHHSTLTFAENSLNYWINTRNMPSEKVVLGLPGYGRASGITQSGTTLTYREILRQGGNPLSDSAIVSKGTFSDYTIYYNGLSTVKKKAMLAKNQANGIMLWELAQDTSGTISLLKAAMDTLSMDY